MTMGTIYKRLICVIAAISITACAATDARFTTVQPPDAGKAIIYVYHTDDSAYLNALEAWVFVRTLLYLDDVKMTSLEDGYYTLVQVPPGRHTASIKVSLYGLPGFPTMYMASVHTKPDGIYYIRYKTVTSYSLPPNPVTAATVGLAAPGVRIFFEEVSETTAMNEMQNMMYSPVEKK